MAEKIRLTGKPLHPRRCGTCAHFDPPDSSLRADAGSCVYHLPQAALIPSANGQIAVLGYFPQMKPEQRCGMWEKIESLESTELSPSNELSY